MRSAMHRRDIKEYERCLKMRRPPWYAAVVAPAILGLLGTRRARLVVGLPNEGRLPNLDRFVQLETWADIDGSVHADVFPDNERYVRDIADFVRTRAIAFAAMIDPSRDNLTRFVQQDPFAAPLAKYDDWQHSMEFETCSHGLLS